MSPLVAALLIGSFPKNARPLFGQLFPGITTIEECDKLFMDKASARPSKVWTISGTSYAISVDGHHAVKGKKGHLIESLEISSVQSPSIRDLISAKTPATTLNAFGAGVIDLRWLGRGRRTILSALQQRKMKPRVTPNAYLLSVPITGNSDFRRYQIELQFTKDSLSSIRVNLTN